MSDEVQNAQESEIPEVQIIQGYKLGETDPFNVISVSIDGDFMDIIVSYSGGCEVHNFDLFFNGFYKKSLPPQIDLALSHNSNDDSCKSLVRDSLKFDISKVKQDYKSVIISLNNYKEKIEYK